MALPSSGSITMAQVNVELGKAANAGITLGDAAVRALAEVPSGAISMWSLYGKSSYVRYINTVDRTQASIHTLMGSPTAAGTYIFENTATISAATQSGWALQTGNFPAGSTLKIINRGHIRGGGGNGSAGSSGGSGGSGGGTALILNFPATLDNTEGTIWGGGGGGGGILGGGGGGGGIPAGAGAGVSAGSSGSEVNGGSAGAGVSAGAGGAVGAAGQNGTAGSGSNLYGGRGGYSVETNGNAVSWIAKGDLRGSVV